VLRARIVVAVVAAAVVAGAGFDTVASATGSLRGKITVRSWEKLNGGDVTRGGVAGRGRFKISGVITDSGKVTDYRTVKGRTITIRRVVAGKHGTVTFRITIRMGNTAPAPWVIASATRRYKGLRGKGTQVVDNFEATPATFVLRGTVSR
jgi:hypothetical protein